MPKGKHHHGRTNRQKERTTRAAMRRERKAGAYLNPGDPDFRSFANQLAEQGLALKDVPGDGNCLFRALSEQLDDGHSSHQSIRKSIVAHMREYQDHFAPFLEEDIPFADYLTELAKDGEYAGNDAIVAFSRCYGVHVVIHQLNEPRWEVHAPFTAPSTKTVHIAYLNGEHYCSVQSLTLAESAPALPLLHHTGKGEERAHTYKKKAKSTSLCPGSTSYSPGSTSLSTGPTSLPGSTSLSTGSTSIPPGSSSLSPAQRVIEATGCKDMALVEECLRENSYDSDLAVVEVFQLMSLADDTPASHRHLPQTHLYSRPSADCTARASPGAGGGISLEKPVRSPSSSKPPSTSAGNSSRKPSKHHHQQPRLSNRERKEQAKAARKQRKSEERKENRTKLNEDAVKDPVGATAI